ncbi:MAG: Kazal-type serine protease inhibitor domain-containing protein [Nannocystaceae bacterium]
MSLRVSWFLLLVSTLGLACTNTTTASGNDASRTPSDTTAPKPEPTPTEPTPEPGPDGSASKVCGARAGDTCGEDEYCAYEPEGMCGWADATAVCKAKPEVCTTEFDPVCGCDQKEYSNACAAAAAGTGVLKKGDCKELPGQ